MQLHEIGMVAGDTSRSRAYLQALARNGLLPGFVLVLDGPTGSTLPGQMGRSRIAPLAEAVSNTDACWSEAHFDPTLPICGLLDELDVPYEVLQSNDINDPVVVGAIRSRVEQVFIYSGFGGGLLRKEMLSVGKRFLHVHGGFLPDYKGSTTNYYSLLSEGFMGASAIFLNEEIDCGPVLLRRKFPPPLNRQAIDHIYDSGARAKVLVETLRRYQANGDWEFELSENAGGETYYIIHPVLKHLTILANEWGRSCE